MFSKALALALVAISAAAASANAASNADGAASVGGIFEIVNAYSGTAVRAYESGDPVFVANT